MQKTRQRDWFEMFFKQALFQVNTSGLQCNFN